MVSHAGSCAVSFATNSPVNGGGGGGGGGPPPPPPPPGGSQRGGGGCRCGSMLQGRKRGMSWQEAEHKRIYNLDWEPEAV